MHLEWPVSWNSTAVSQQVWNNEHIKCMWGSFTFSLSSYSNVPLIGPAPEVKPTGLFERYQARYFGKNPSGMRT